MDWTQSITQEEIRMLPMPGDALITKIYEYLARRCRNVKNEEELKLLIEMIYTINNINGLYGEPYEPHRKLMIDFGLSEAKYQAMMKQHEFNEKLKKRGGCTLEEMGEVWNELG